ncbi:uncharacterized protein TNCV_2724391 [Trichonephila clavipes]|nr:uncharacterized protein TNCV_2724391 [Trichonephila clavipes]
MTRLIEFLNINVALFSYTRAFGDGPRHFEPWSSDVDDTCEQASPLLTTTPHQRENVSSLDRFNVHRYPTRRVFSGTGLELVTRQATIRYLYHSATAATPMTQIYDHNHPANVATSTWDMPMLFLPKSNLFRKLKGPDVEDDHLHDGLTMTMLKRIAK